MTGKLFKTEWDNWLLIVDGVFYPIHQQHSFWLKLWGEEGMEFKFEIVGGDVIIKPSGPDTHSYTQD